MSDTKDVNLIGLLIGIKEDVSAIKTNVSNLKESQQKDRMIIEQKIEDIKADFSQNLATLKEDVTNKLNTYKCVQTTLVADIDILKTEIATLKHKEDKKDAKKWRAVLALVGTALGGMFIAKLPDILRLFLVK